MSNVTELLTVENNGLSFGDYSLEAKTKLADFGFNGNTYKVKTFKEITRLEKNDRVVYESVPGSAVHELVSDEKKVTFKVEAMDDLQISLRLEPETEYKVYVDDTNIGKMKSNLGGIISFSIELNQGETAEIKVVKM